MGFCIGGETSNSDFDLLSNITEVGKQKFLAGTGLAASTLSLVYIDIPTCGRAGRRLSKERAEVAPN